MGNIMRILPDDLREILKEPIDKLVDERGLLKLLKKEEYIVSVGDQVTYTLLKHNIEPVFCIVDFKIKREHSPSDIKNMIQTCGTKKVVIRKTPGCI